MSYEKLRQKALLWKIFHCLVFSICGFYGFYVNDNLFYKHIKGKKVRWLLVLVIYLSINVITFYY